MCIEMYVNTGRGLLVSRKILWRKCKLELNFCIGMLFLLINICAFVNICYVTLPLCSFLTFFADVLRSQTH